MMGKAANRRRNQSVEVVDPKVAVDLATAQTYSENVFLFVPNLIGTHPASTPERSELTPTGMLQDTHAFSLRRWPFIL